MARKPFGFTTADVTLDASGNVQAGVSLSVWTAQTGGTQVTDLQTAAGVALAGGVVVSDVHGQIGFLGPADGTSSLWIDGGAGVRYLMNTTTGGGGGGTGTITSVNGNAGPVIVLSATDVGADPAGAATTAQSNATSAAATDATAKVLTETTARINADALKADLVAGVVPTSQLPALALTTAVPVANQAAMLALTSSQVQPGDIAVRADGAGSFILTAVDPSVLGNWLRINAPTDAVVSVNGQTGTVVLSAADVGADTVALRNTAIAAALATSQPVDADLTTIAALDSTVAGVLASTGSGWVSRTYAQIKASLGLVKADVGLGNVDNTADTAKPVSTAQQTALDAKMAALTVTAVKTANYTLAANEAARFDTTSGSLTGTLPTAPADKTLALVKNVIQGGTNTVTIACGGSDTLNRVGGATSYVLPLLAQGALLEYRAADATWTIIADDLALSQLDARYALLSTVTTKGDILAATAAGVLARLGVGANNTVLTADSTAATGVKWATPSGGSSVPAALGGVTTGATLYHIPSGIGAGASSIGRGINSLVATPLQVDRACTLDRVGIRTTAAVATSVVRLGLYNDDGSGQPGTLIADFGTIDTSTAGYQELTVSQALTANLYWLAAVNQVAANSGVNVYATPLVLPRLRAASAFGLVNLIGNGYGAPLRASVTGALPSPFTPSTTDLCPTSGVPIILARFT